MVIHRFGEDRTRLTDRLAFSFILPLEMCEAPSRRMYSLSVIEDRAFVLFRDITDGWFEEKNEDQNKANDGD